MSNWLDKYGNGGKTSKKSSPKKNISYNPLEDPKNKPTVVFSKDRSNYDPLSNNIYFNPNNNPWHPEDILKHEGYHWAQNMYGDLQAPELYPGPLRRPQTPTNPNTSLVSDYYNRAALENQVSLNYMKEGRNAYVDEKGKSLMPDDRVIPSSPSLQFIPDDVIWKGIRTTNRPYNEYTRVPGADALRYNTPDTIEGDAAHYEDYTPTNNKPIMGMYGLEDTLGYKQGGLIKRADGSYSKRGLWDNIRANRGSGKKPTAEMLRQERKIKKHADGGWIDMYNDGSWVADSSIPQPTTPSFYPAGEDRTLTNYQMGTDKAPMYAAGSTVGEDILIDPRTGKPAILLPEIKVIGKRNKQIDSTNVRESTFVNTPKFNDPITTNSYDENWFNPDYAASAANKLLKEHNVKVDSTGNMLKDIGLPSGAYYNPITRTINYNSNSTDSKAAKLKYFTKVVTEIPHAIQADRMGTIPFLVNIGLDGLSYPHSSIYETPGTLENEAHSIIEPQLKEEIGRAALNYPSIHKQGGPVMYNAGSTVWTNQDTPLWAAGSTTPTSTQNFRNTGSLNTSRYRIGDVIPTGMDYKTPAAGTYDYNKDIQPPKQMVLHAPDTTIMARHGGHIKKHINSPRVYGNPVNPQGMFQGPTSQRGITFADGGWINKYETAGPVVDGNNPGGRTDLTYDAKTNAYYKPLADGSLYPASQVTVDVNGTNKTLWTDSDEYKNMYGNLMSYNPNTDMLQGKTFEPVEVVADAPDTYNNYMLRKHKNDGLVGAMFGMPLDYVASFPQAAATKFFSGKYQTPSEAMDIQNSYLGAGIDIVADPTNLLGVGLLDDSYKLYNASKLIGKGFKEVAQGVGQKAIETGRGMYNAVSQIPRNAYNYAFRSNRNSLPLLDNSALNTDDLMATIRQNIADRNAARSTPPVYTPEQMSLMNLRDRLNAGEALSSADVNYLYFDSFGNPRNVVYNNNTNTLDFDFINNSPSTWASYYNNSNNLNLNTGSSSSSYVKPKVSASNKSGLTKEEALERAAVKDKDVISKMTEEEFANTVVKPNGEVVTYKSGPDISQVGYDTATRETKLADAEYVDTDNYVKQFNDNIDELNASIAKNNTSGVDYKVKELTPDNRLIFESPILGQGGVNTTTTWGVRIKPGKWQGTVEDIANKEYYRAIPGLEITNSMQGLFADGVVRRGTGIYGSLNDYLKNLGMGRVKPGFNSQTKYSRGLWEDAVKKEKAFGFYGGKDVVYGAMKKLGGPIDKNTKKQSNGGWIEQYN